MNSLIMHSQEEVTPGVILDKVKGIFEISGWSYPEDAGNLYTPVLEWLQIYSESPNPETDFRFRLQYFNSASAKQILRIIFLLENIAKKSKTKIQWYYDKEDTEILSSGERFSKMSPVPFEFIPC